MPDTTDQNVEHLLDGVRVVDAAGEPAAMAGRVLGDLGAEVVKVGDPREAPFRRSAWDRGCARVAEADPELLASADVVVETPGWPGCPVLDPADAPGAVWVTVTPFGVDGPRSGWRASDLGVMASSGNMHATGDPDRPPVRCTEPTGYAHVGPEVAFAALTGLAAGRPLRVDLSMQEVVLVANMCSPSRFIHTGAGFRRRGANVGRTREIWPCKDGWVSFGIRGGKARVRSLELVTKLCTEEGVATSALTERDWSEFSHTKASAEELAAIAEPIGRYFERHTMQELYEIACETNLMLAPINSPREIYASAQLAAREFFDDEGFPQSWTAVHSPEGADSAVAPVAPRLPAPTPEVLRPFRQPRVGGGDKEARGAPTAAWDGVKIVEFGSGAAGPIATRYFTEHGATVVRVESRTRPDFLRVYALGPDNPHGLEGSHMFDGLNAGKLSITLDLKNPEGVAVAKQLVHWADAVSENFAPRAMKGFGLDYQTLAAEKPDLVMVSACLNGQTGPHKDYPGFGGQGAALSGYNFLTGWPDREPVGPFGTITDSLAPRFVATALAAGLLYRRRTGKGAHLDVSQVEAAIWTLSPWLLRYHRDGEITERMGNRSARAVPHGAFPGRGDDRWVAIACHTDDEWRRLATHIGLDDPSLDSLEARLDRIDEVEAAVAAWTGERAAEEVAEALQALGVEAVPVEDFADLLSDPQLEHRGHFVTLEHPFMGEGPYERNGFRIFERAAGPSLDGSPETPSGYARCGPTLGQDTQRILTEFLDLDDAEVVRLQESGALD